MARRRRPRSRWRRHRRYRRLAAAALLLLGAVSLATEFRGPVEAAGVAAAVAVRDVRSGSVISPQDVLITDVPLDSPLRGVALAPEAVIGRSALGDLLAGEMITASRITEQAARPGYATMPVSFADPELTPFLTPGMRIDIVWTPDEMSGRAPEVVAVDARVLQVGTGSDAVDRGPGASMPVLLEVAEPDTVRLAGAMGSGSLSVLVR